jgi:hypothetical protein
VAALIFGLRKREERRKEREKYISDTRPGSKKKKKSRGHTGRRHPGSSII